jgi:hypothetical protein
MDKLIPADLLNRLNNLGETLAGHILGQDEVVADITALLRRAF